MPLSFTLQITSWKGHVRAQRPHWALCKKQAQGVAGRCLECLPRWYRWELLLQVCYTRKSSDTQFECSEEISFRDRNTDAIGTTASRGRWQLREILRAPAWNMEPSLIVLLDSLTVFPEKSGTHWTKTLLKYPLKWEKESTLLSQQPRVLNELVEDLSISRMNFKQL